MRKRMNREDGECYITCLADSKVVVHFDLRCFCVRVWFYRSHVIFFFRWVPWDVVGRPCQHRSRLLGLETGQVPNRILIANVRGDEEVKEEPTKVQNERCDICLVRRDQSIKQILFWHSLFRKPTRIREAVFLVM
jgi:hypothetical protein